MNQERHAADDQSAAPVRELTEEQLAFAQAVGRLLGQQWIRESGRQSAAGGSPIMADSQAADASQPLE